MTGKNSFKLSQNGVIKAKRKIHLVAKPHDKGIKFSDRGGKYTAFFAGGNEAESKWIIKELVDLFGLKDGKRIYKQFSAALISLGTKTDSFDEGVAALTLYVDEYR